MVKFGFIVEGDTEKILLESAEFKNFLNNLGVEFVPEVINVSGNNNLLPHKRKEFSEILISKGANQIIILTDQDADKCVTETKARISPNENQICIIAKREIESWFLADNVAMKNFIGANIASCEFPEVIEHPFNEIWRIKLEKTNRGFVKNKRYLANLMVKSGFSFERAACHPNCSSAKYFIDKLILLSKK